MSKVKFILNPWQTDARNKFWPHRISTADPLICISAV